ncbi:unnamed protein product [Cylindrotheca closterium]|uniref:Ion transport domain-containing protein n=1 Tax=Cylindrotheca closterium TaxID=2856 RepID=A0AAD2CRT2_9STRA|nr:unnamed protein product [Cylindrotheca closterium]
MASEENDKLLKNGENDIAETKSANNMPQSTANDPKLKTKHNMKEGVVTSDMFSAGDDDDDDSSVDEEEDSFLWQARMKVGGIVNNEKVQIFIIVAIMINALMMGVATFDFVEDNENVDRAFHEIDRAFLIIFTIEAVLQLFYLGVSLFSDGWLIFDLAIVILSWSFESLQIVRAFRIFRAFRLITRVKPLRDLVLAIGAVLPRMYAIAALLLLVFYIFSVLFTELFSDLDLGPGKDYFGTLDRSLFTCMEMMTLEWGEICRLVMEYHRWAFAPFLSFIAITGFIVFNLIVAVVCDAVAVTEKTVRQMDGYEEDDTEVKIIEAQERIDLLQSHIYDMLKTQEQVQVMIEKMAEEMVFLQTERLNAEQRESRLRSVVEERQKYEMQMEEKYFEGKKKREEMRTSTIIGNPLFDADSLIPPAEEGDLGMDASSHIKKRKKQLQKRASDRRSNSQLGDESIGENSTIASLNASHHRHDFEL